MLDEGKEQEYLALAGELRQAGVGVELYPEARKLGAQLEVRGPPGLPLRGHRQRP